MTTVLDLHNTTLQVIEVTESKTGLDSSAIHDSTADEISNITEKIDIIDNDLILLEDSEDTYKKKKVKTGSLLNLRKPYALLYINNNTTSDTISTGIDYTKLINFTNNGLYYNAVPDYTYNIITLNKIGIYKVNFNSNLISDTDNIELSINLFLNNIEQYLHTDVKVLTGTDVISININGFIEITEEAELDVRVKHSHTGDVDLTFTYGNLNIEYMSLGE